jgi:hypothetical protein
MNERTVRSIGRDYRIFYDYLEEEKNDERELKDEKYYFFSSFHTTPVFG